MIPYNTSIEEVVVNLGSSVEEGLSVQEAMARLEKDGANKLPEGKKQI